MWESGLANLFCAACNLWRGASSHHTVCTSLRSGRRPCRCSSDTSSRGDRVLNTRSTTRRAKGQNPPAAPAAWDTTPGCVFASRTGSRCQPLRRQRESPFSFYRRRRRPRAVRWSDSSWLSVRARDMRSTSCVRLVPLCALTVARWSIPHCPQRLFRWVGL